MSTLTTAEVLRGAKAVLQEQGWHQGSDYSRAQFFKGVRLEECAVCLRGAVALARFGNPVWDGTHIDALDLLDRLIDDNGVAGWNDESGRTLAEVYALLDKAIERAEAGGPR